MTRFALKLTLWFNQGVIGLGGLMDGARLFEQVIGSLGLPEDLSRPWFLEKIQQKNLKIEELTLESLRELTAEIFLDFILDPNFQPLVVGAQKDPNH